MINIIKKNLNDSICLLKNKKIFGFGCGIQGGRVAYYLKSWGLDNNTIAFIDNDKDKIGKKIEYLGCSYDIVSLEAAIKWIKQNNAFETTIILVTSFYHKEIYNQIDREYPNYCINCMSMNEISSEQFKVSSYDCVVKSYKQQVIPKNIHYVWLGGEKPDSVKCNIENWHKMCPGYEITEWNECNYDITQNKYIEEAYGLAKWAFVSDYMRLDIIFKHGGIYLDTDIKIVGNVDDLLYQEAFGCCDASLTFNSGSGFGARANHPIIKKMRDYYDNISFLNVDGSIDARSCNSHQLIVLSELEYKNNDLLQSIGNMNIYPMSFQGANYCTREYKIQKGTYWIHYGNMSWFSKNTK